MPSDSVVVQYGNCLHTNTFTFPKAYTNVIPITTHKSFGMSINCSETNAMKIPRGQMKTTFSVEIIKQSKKLYVLANIINNDSSLNKEIICRIINTMMAHKIHSRQIFNNKNFIRSPRF